MFGPNHRERERTSRPPYDPAYQRKGKVVHLQLDFDALAMLYELSPTRKSFGRYLSELVRRDYVRRQEWEKARAGLPVLIEVDAFTE
jgi:hypothetical protein